MGLAEYKRKRDFKKTAEPAGKVAKKRAKKLSFVIQKHAATRLHYDFRLELDGVLKSWAVPKGPSLDPKERRLAVQVEDHPLAYATFEGVIPEGEYGAGEVIVWDRGFWTPVGEPHDALRKGRLEFELRGEKLAGTWILVNTSKREAAGKANWLLIKRSDEAAKESSQYEVTQALPASAKTGRTIEELQGRASPSPKKTSKKSTTSRTTSLARKKAARPRAKSAKTKRSSKKAAGKSADLPRFIEPQLATLRDTAPSGPNWLHEMKLDGYRILAWLEKGRVRLMTRREQDWTHRYPGIAQSLAKFKVFSAIFDGELVALEANGVSSFQALQNALNSGDQSRLVYFLFDLLYLNGKDLRDLPLRERKALLAEVLEANGNEQIRLSEHFENEGPTFFREACRLGLEGIICKRADVPYRPGRSEEWLKVKCVSSEEMVIGGYTVSTVVDRGIGALLVGYFEGKDFIYSGRVGTGFSIETLRGLRQRLERIRQDKCPFREIPAKERRGNVRWVKPELVAQLEFTGWTEAAILRHPSFQGLREDKAAKSVGRPESLRMATSVRGKKSKPAKKSSASKANDEATKLPVELTHPDRILWSDTGLTKLGLATYYHEVADWILPHLEDRPLSLVRCPEGQKAGKCFFQKHAGPGTPAALKRIEITEKNEAETYVMANNLEGLLSLVQMSVLEIHPWGSRADKLENPNRLTFDLDPDEAVPWKQMVTAARAVREVLQQYDLESFLKTTGGKGLHVVVPLNPRRADWDTAKAFSRHVAEQLAAQEPDRYVATMSKAARHRKIFVDYLRNDRGATAVAPYSTRAKPGASVSMPIAWDELSANLQSDHFGVDNAVARLHAQRSDPWAEFFRTKQTLPRIASLSKTRNR